MNTQKDITRLNTLFEIAKDLDPAGHAKLVAAIYIKNELIAVGWNQFRTSPLAAKYGKNDKAIYLHAEIHAIKQALRQVSVDQLARGKTTLYICRAKKLAPGGKFVWGLSKPCIGCLRAIIDFGIKRVVYSLDEIEEGGKKYDELP